MRNLIRWVLVIFHLAAGIVALFGLFISDPHEFRAWYPLSLLFLAFPVLMIVIGAGLQLQRRWVKWLIIPLLGIILIFTFILLAGSVLWPESFAYGIIVFSVVFIAIEISAIICAGISHERTLKE